MTHAGSDPGGRGPQLGPEARKPARVSFYIKEFEQPRSAGIACGEGRQGTMGSLWHLVM